MDEPETQENNLVLVSALPPLTRPDPSIDLLAAQWASSSNADAASACVSVRARVNSRVCVRAQLLPTAHLALANAQANLRGLSPEQCNVPAAPRPL